MFFGLVCDEDIKIGQMKKSRFEDSKYGINFEHVVSEECSLILWMLL